MMDRALQAQAVPLGSAGRACPPSEGLEVPPAPPATDERQGPIPREQDRLDEALNETFPASDPIGSNRIAHYRQGAARPARNSLLVARPTSARAGRDRTYPPWFHARFARLMPR